jgi:hypothetical protein
MQVRRKAEHAAAFEPKNDVASFSFANSFTPEVLSQLQCCEAMAGFESLAIRANPDLMAAVRKIRFSICVSSFLIALSVAQEARVSVIAENVDLANIVGRSPMIVIAKRETNLTGMRTESIDTFRVVDILKGEDARLKKGERIEVFGANAELFAQIGKMQSRGEPTPMPILPVYKGGLAETEFEQTSEMILFLSTDGKGRLRFAMEGARESVKLKAKILELIPPKSPSLHALEIFTKLPKVMAGAPGSDELTSKYRAEKSAFVEAVAYRNMNTCKSGQHEFPNVVYHIYVPKKGLLGREKTIEAKELEMHEARSHGAALPRPLVDFLESI